MQLNFKIKQSFNIVFEYLTDMQKFASVHPVIYKIENTGHKTFLVYERFKSDLVRYSFTYPVTVDKDLLDAVIIMRATVFKLIKIEMKFSLSTDGCYTIIEEDIQFKSFLPVAFIMRSVFKKQHIQLFKNIEIQWNRVLQYLRLKEIAIARK